MSSSSIVAGRKYHLVIKSFNCRNDDSSIKSAVKLFIDKVFAIGSVPSPLEYYDHKFDADQNNPGNQILRLEFARVPNVNISLETALEEFCQRFFERAQDDVAHTLSALGKLGYSAEEPTFKGYWYKALFSCMHGNLDAIALQNKIDQIRKKNKQKLKDWLPDWQGAALLAISIGSTAFCTSSSTSAIQQVENYAKARSCEKFLEDLIPVANLVLNKIACINEAESDPQDILKEANNKCRNLMKNLDDVSKIMIDEPSQDRPTTKIHLEINQSLITVFENGFETITTCQKAMEFFIKSRSQYIGTSLVAAAQATRDTFAATTAFIALSEIRCLPEPNIPVKDNFFNWAKSFTGLVDTTPGKIAAAAKKNKIMAERTNQMNVLRILGWLAAGQAAYSVFRTGRGLMSVYQSHLEAKKWESAADTVYEGIRYVQMCEEYIRWTYHSAGGSAGMSREQLQILELQTMPLLSRVPSDEELIPSAVRARILQYGNELNQAKNRLEACL